jgi:hypothetical protein
VYQTAKNVLASYHMLMVLFESIERFLGRLEISAKITSSEAMKEIKKDVLAKAMIEIISALALATKHIKRGRLSEARLR